MPGELVAVRLAELVFRSVRLSPVLRIELQEGLMCSSLSLGGNGQQAAQLNSEHLTSNAHSSILLTLTC